MSEARLELTSRPRSTAEFARSTVHDWARISLALGSGREELFVQEARGLFHTRWKQSLRLRYTHSTRHKHRTSLRRSCLPAWQSRCLAGFGVLWVRAIWVTITVPEGHPARRRPVVAGKGPAARQTQRKGFGRGHAPISPQYGNVGDSGLVSSPPGHAHAHTGDASALSAADRPALISWLAGHARTVTHQWILRSECRLSQYIVVCVQTCNPSRHSPASHFVNLLHSLPRLLAREPSKPKPS